MLKFKVLQAQTWETDTSSLTLTKVVLKQKNTHFFHIRNKAAVRSSHPFIVGMNLTDLGNFVDAY